jgi:hypothetical protein
MYFEFEVWGDPSVVSRGVEMRGRRRRTSLVGWDLGHCLSHGQLQTDLEVLERE